MSRRSTGLIVAILALGACAGQAPAGPVEPPSAAPSSTRAAAPAPAPSSSASSASSASPSPSLSPSPAGALGRTIEGVLGRVRVAPTRYVPGYDRACTPGHGCVFGPEWTDAHTGPGGRNGCDTRQDVLLRQLTDIERRWGSRCRIYQGRLRDPYSGRALTWRRDGYAIQIDHVYPLGEAWYAGAAAWPRAKRVRFANDVRRELLAVSAAANQAKGSRTPAEWLPAYRPFRCRYVLRYLRVARFYGLSITPADVTTARRVARTCG